MPYGFNADKSKYDLNDFMDEVKSELTADDIGAVPTTRKVNNKALSSDITLSASDVGAAASGHTHSASDVGAVPTTRKVNNKALSGDITITQSDLNIVYSATTPTAVNGMIWLKPI